MGKTLLGLLVAGGLFLLWAMGGYNSLVTLDESAKASWAQVENQYQRRADLVPNLVATVKGASEFEQETLTGVIEARASATKMDVNLESAQEMAEFQEGQTGISQALGRLLMVTENYPTLQSNAQFQDLMVQLEGTENRITTARMDYNNSVKEYNTKLRTFPTNIVGKIFGFERYTEFTAEAGSNVAPDVSFE